MADTRINRKLAAILVADVVGYSRLMGADEAGTLAALKKFRETIFDPAVAAHNGRIVKLIGDGTIVEFASVVDAVTCALLQIDALNAGLFLSAALFCQGFFSPKRYARRDRPRNNIAYFPRWSDQQAKFAEDQMGLFEVGCCGRLGHRFLDASFTSAIRGYLNALGPKVTRNTLMSDAI